MIAAERRNTVGALVEAAEVEQGPAEVEVDRGPVDVGAGADQVVEVAPVLDQHGHDVAGDEHLLGDGGEADGARPGAVAGGEVLERQLGGRGEGARSVLGGIEVRASSQQLPAGGRVEVLGRRGGARRGGGPPRSGRGSSAGARTGAPASATSGSAEVLVVRAKASRMFSRSGAHRVQTTWAMAALSGKAASRER